MPILKRSAAEQSLLAASGPDFLEALARGLRVLEAFNRDRKQLTLSDIAKLVDLPRASVRRTLHTLVQLGYAEINDRLFRLTPRVLALARAYLQSNAVTDILQPALERLSEAGRGILFRRGSGRRRHHNDCARLAEAHHSSQRADWISFAGGCDLAGPGLAGGAGRSPPG